IFAFAIGKIPSPSAPKPVRAHDVILRSPFFDMSTPSVISIRSGFLSPAGFSGLALFAVWSVSAARAAQGWGEADVFAFTDKYCSACHNDVDKDGGLDLTSLRFLPADEANFLTWVTVHDRVQAGEMPPKEKKRPNQTDVGAFMKGLATTLTAAD